MDRTHDERVSERPGATWDHTSAWPTAKQRAGVEQAVRRVLEALVPDRAPPRHGEPRGAVQRYRSPRGCILQGDAAAVTVSWFPSTANDDALGELQVISWAGVVSRPGSTHRSAEGARPVAEALLRPIPSATDTWAWRTADGTVLDADAVAAHCLRLLADLATPPGIVAAAS